MSTDIDQNDVLSKKRPVTAGFEFRRSMSDSIKRLSSNQQFYVRCIKPNDNLNDNCFDVEKVRHQIQYLGLVENARVRKAGYWRQMSYTEFIQRYRMLLSTDVNFETEDELTDDKRNSYVLLCQNILQNSLETNEEYNVEEFDCSRIAFGKTIVFLRDPVIIESLEQKRMNTLEYIIREIQTYGRSFLAQKRFHRMQTCRKIFNHFFRMKSYAFVCELLNRLSEFEKQYLHECSSVPKQFLEFFNLNQFQFPKDLVYNSILFRNNSIFTESLPELVDYMGNCLMVLKFSDDYWMEKLLRLDAYKIFNNRKVEWGQTRRRWLGNYLISPNECFQHARFGEMLARDSKRFGIVLFSSYIVKTNKYNLDKIYAIVVTSNDIFKVDVESMTFTRWTLIMDIHSISVTPGADQLVVIHTKSTNNDLVFSFCTLRESLLSISTTQLAFECGNGGINAHSAKVGELVTLLYNQYLRLTNTYLPINFNDTITFKFDRKMNRIEVINKNRQQYDSVMDRVMSKLKNFFTLKNFRHLYVGILLNDHNRLNSERLAKTVEFQKISNRNFVLVYDS